MGDGTEFWYPTVEDVLTIHEDIVAEDPDAEPGVREPDRIRYAIDHVRHGHFGEGPETVHEKAFDLLRLIAANHWFVDGNKRTALNTTELFYALNGFEFEYGEDVRSMLKLLSVRQGLLDRDESVAYLAERTTRRTEEELSEFAEMTIGGVALLLTLAEAMERAEIDPADLDPRDGDDHNR